MRRSAKPSDSAPIDSGGEARIERASWIAQGLLLLALRVPPAASPEEARGLVSKSDEAEVELGSRWLDCTPQAARDAEHLFLVTAAVPAPVRQAGLGRLAVRD